MKTIRWGIIGCGDVTEVKSGPGFRKADHSELVAVMRRDGKLAEDYARRHNVARWYDDADALIADPEVDAVYVATPPSSHKDYTLRAAAAGKPVYVEKPMAMNHAECLEMISACRAADMPLFVAYYRRALERFLRIKALLEDGAIGTPRFVNTLLYQENRVEPDVDVPWRVLPDIAGGGLFVDLASHTLDFLDFALGPIRSARGFAANQGGHYPAEDIVCGAFEFESGVLGTGSWCFTAFEEVDQTEIIGTAGKIAFSTFDDTPIRLTTADGIEEISIAYPDHIQQPLIQSIVGALNGMGSCPSSGESGARTAGIVEQLLLPIDATRTPI